MRYKFYKYQSDTYKEQFLPMTLDMCLILSGKANGGFDELSRSLAATLAKPLRKMFLAKENKFPENCPIKAVRYIKI